MSAASGVWNMPSPTVDLPGADADELAARAGATRDDAAMCAVREGRIEALSDLYDRHARRLLSFFLRSGGVDRGGAEDLVQEVFVRMLKYRATYRPGTRFLVWMYSIARNVRRDRLRKHRGEVAWDETYAASARDPDHADAGEQQRLLAAALARLVPEKREVIVLSRYQEMNYDCIGALLGCGAGAVKVRVHRAIRELRRHYLALSAAGGRP